MSKICLELANCNWKILIFVPSLTPSNVIENELLKLTNVTKKQNRQSIVQYFFILELRKYLRAGTPATSWE